MGWVGWVGWGVRGVEFNLTVSQAQNALVNYFYLPINQSINQSFLFALLLTFLQMFIIIQQPSCLGIFTSSSLYGTHPTFPTKSKRV